MTAIVIAHTVQRATALAIELGVSAVAMSPRSIKAGACRGLTCDSEIVVDDALWPLDDDVLDVLHPTTLGAAGHVSIVPRSRRAPLGGVTRGVASPHLGA